jgi:ADP-ribosyl-[dinitrogen reductase] hydrolase
MSLHERIAGSLYGLLVGDAFGCPVEGWSAERIVEVHGRLDAMEVSTVRPRPRGLHSDDGQQAMALCDALLWEPDAPEAEWARLVVEMYRAGAQAPGDFGLHRGTGRNFRAMVLALDAGASLREAAQPSSGNGVAMLIAPVAWYWRGDLDPLREVAVRVATVKQRDVRGVAAGGAVAYLVSHALIHGDWQSLDDRTYVDFVRDVEERAAQASGAPRSDVFSRALAEMLAARTAARPEVLDLIVRNARATASGECEVGSAYAPASVVTSIYMALTSDTFDNAVRDTVHLGGDADTTGAMVGALAGARFGRSAIPPAWYDALVARGAFDDRIAPLVDRARGWRPVRSLLDAERGFTYP